MRTLRLLLTQFKELDNLLIAAAAVLGIIGVFVDERIRALVPLVAVVGAVMFAAHLVRQARQARQRKAAAVQVPLSDRQVIGG